MTAPMMDGEVMAKLLARARSEYRDSDAAGDVLDWLDHESAALAAPSAGAEAALWVNAKSLADMRLIGINAVRADHQDIKAHTVPLYTAPQSDAMDAARYRWLRKQTVKFNLSPKFCLDSLDAAIDAALAGPRP